MAVVLDALASYVRHMLTEMAKEEVHMLLGVHGEISKMDKKLMDLKNFLADAARRSIDDLTVQGWVRELRGAMCDATDILDLCHLQAMERDQARDMGWFNPLLFSMRNPIHAHDIGNRIKKLNQRLDDIKARGADFNFILGSYKDYTKTHSSRCETGEMLDKSSVVGEKIKEDTRYLVERLTEEEEISFEDNGIMVFAIVGIGGIGKTTLARMIFNDGVIQQEFRQRIWLSVNQGFDENKLLRDAILSAEGGDQVANCPKNILEKNLKQTLEGEKTLLVMDDVWNGEAWERVLKAPLVNAVARGSRILITSRHDSVARGMKAAEPYHRVEKLEPEDAWSLLKMEAARNEYDKQEIETLKDIGMRIIEKCDCLPVAVKVMGGLLRQKEARPGDWEEAAEDSLWSVSDNPDQPNHAYSALRVSYEDLHPSLKQCFLHFSLIPRGYTYTNHLVSMWISEGFVHGDLDKLEDIGRGYQEELISRNLIDPRSVDQSYCDMHDIMRSFAHYVARDEALVGTEGTDIISKLNSQKFLRFTYERSETSELEWSSLQQQKSLRTIISVGGLKIKPGDSLVSFSSLRTLHLNSTNNCDALLGSLCQLRHLRYLCMRNCGISMLPENIGMSKLLLLLDISGNESLVTLPGSIVKLRLLRHLSFGGTGINKIPQGFNALDNLRHLDVFPAHMDGEWCSLQELGPLCHLSYLVIHCLENVPSSSFARKARLVQKLRLRSLFLDCTSRLRDDGRLVGKEEPQQRILDVFDGLFPPPGLETLGIVRYYGRRLPRWMMSTEMASLKRLRNILIDHWTCCMELPDGLCKLPSLEVLDIRSAPAIRRVGHEFLQHNHSQVAAPVFRRLRMLHLSRMEGWLEWEWDKQVHAMPALQEFSLQHSKLRHLPPGLAFHARALRKVNLHYVQNLSSLENFDSVVDLTVEWNPDLERISNLPKLRKLDMRFCPKMKELEGVPALETLRLDDHKMEVLPRYLKRVHPRHLLLHCTIELLSFVASRELSLEWDKLKHIQQVKAYADYQGARKLHVLYTRDPFSFQTNISPSAIAGVKRFGYLATCSVENTCRVMRAYNFIFPPDELNRRDAAALYIERVAWPLWRQLNRRCIESVALPLWQLYRRLRPFPLPRNTRASAWGLERERAARNQPALATRDAPRVSQREQSTDYVELVHVLVEIQEGRAVAVRPPSASAYVGNLAAVKILPPSAVRTARR